MDPAIFHQNLKSSFYAWQAFLDSWLGREFIREAAFNYPETTMVRKLSTNTNHFLKQCLFFCDPDQNKKRLRTAPHVYASVFNYKECAMMGQTERPIFSSAVIDKLPFDFDGKIAGDVPTVAELRVPFEKAKEIAGELCGHMWFTARKGFQVHVPLGKALTIEEYIRRQNKITQIYGYNEEEDCGLHHNPQFTGDVSRVCRLPYSIHPTSGLQAIPITSLKVKLEDVLRKAHDFTKPAPVPLLGDDP